MSLPLVVLLQSGPVPLSPPDLQADVNFLGVLAWAAFNPVTLAVAFFMGRQADQPAKLGIAGFAGALAGIALLWLAARLHLGFAVDIARAAVGVFVCALPFAVACAWVGRRTRS